MSKENNIPNPEDYKVLGISCDGGEEAVNVKYESSAISASCPNGKHRWSYQCKDHKGNKSDTKYTNWICD